LPVGGSYTITLTVTDSLGLADPTPATTTVTVNLQPLTFLVSTSSGGGGTMSPFSAIVKQGDTTSFTVTPDFTFNVSAVTGCGGSMLGNTYTTGPITADCAVIASFTSSPFIASLNFGIKQLQFSWSAVNGATHYRLFESPDGVSGFTQVGADIVGSSVKRNVSVHLLDWANAGYLVEACQNTTCVSSNEMSPTDGVLQSIGYFKASNPGAGDFFSVIAISGDGNTLAVGAEREDSSATGVNGNQNDETASNSGAVYVFTYNGSVWNQQAYIKASNTQSGDFFGSSVVISDDGNTLAVVARGEDSGVSGINGDQVDNTASGSGAVYVFTRTSSVWSQQAYIKASNTDASDGFGKSIALNANGDTLVVGADGERSAATGINGNQADNSVPLSGAVYVFTRSGAIWRQQAYVKASNAADSDYFGSSVALNTDGNTLAVGAIGEDSGAVGVNGNQADNSVIGAGAVYVFTRSGSFWSQQAYLKSSNPNFEDYFGRANLALSDDGNTLAIGAHNEDSNAAGINGNQLDNSLASAGAMYVFTRSGTAWSQQAYVKASNTGAGDQFGWSFAISGDGSRLAVGAYRESSNAIGLNGNQLDDSTGSAGAVYIFVRSGSVWRQESYLKASNTEAKDLYGIQVAINNDGSAVAVGAYGESSFIGGVDGNQLDNSAINAGAVYLY